MSSVRDKWVLKTSKIIFVWERKLFNLSNSHFPKELVNLIASFSFDDFYFVSKNSKQPQIPLFKNIKYLNNNKTIQILNTVAPVFGCKVWKKNKLVNPLDIYFII